MHSRQFSTSDYDEYDQSFGNKKLNKVISENSPFKVRISAFSQYKKDYTNPSVQTTHKKTYSLYFLIILEPKRLKKQMLLRIA